MDRDTALTALIGLSIAGLAVAGYQTYEYYLTAGTVCDLSATFSCSAVTGSRFGAFPPGSGIATAAWGVLWWSGVLVLAGGLRTGREWVAEQAATLFALVATGTVFVGYLLIVELYILPRELGVLTICPLCTAQHVLILAILALAYRLLDRPVRTSLAAALRST